MFKKIKAVVIMQLTQGVSPRSLALSCALAFVLGTFPILGATTFLIFIAALWLRLNQPIMQALNYGLTPLHLLLIPVYLRIGEWILREPPVSFNPQEIVTQFFDNWRVFLENYGVAGLHAIFAWALIAPIIGVVIFFSLKPLFEKIQRRYAR